MSFSYETKNELCRLPVQKLCCARAEAYGILLYCNTFSATEVRVITENPNFAERLPKLFRRAFGLSFDRQPDKEQTEGKRIFQITDPRKLNHIINVLGYDPQQRLWRSRAIRRHFYEEHFLPAAASQTRRSAIIWS